MCGFARKPLLPVPLPKNPAKPAQPETNNRTLITRSNPPPGRHKSPQNLWILVEALLHRLKAWKISHGADVLLGK
jgi:hypothetical protein